MVGCRLSGVPSDTASVDGPGLYESDGSHDARSRYLELIAAGTSPAEVTAALKDEWVGMLEDGWEGATGPAFLRHIHLAGGALSGLFYAPGLV